MFTKIDADNSGELDVQEFMKGCQEDQVKVDTLIAVVGCENTECPKKKWLTALIGNGFDSFSLLPGDAKKVFGLRDILGSHNKFFMSSDNKLN